MKNRWQSAALFAVFSLMTAAGCGGTGSDDSDATSADAVRVASFDFAESRLIAELYAQVLEAAGYPVDRLGPIGPREVVAPALEQGHIDLVPEYLGTAAAHFAGDPDDVAGLDAALAERGLVLFEPAPAEDVNVFVVTESTAEEFGLASLSDLVDVAGGMRIGGPVECPSRPLCLEGLVTTYGISFAEFVPLPTLAATAEALVRGEVEVGVMFSTAASLSAGPFEVLDDDRGLQPAENIVPLARRDAVERWGAGLQVAVDGLSAQLTTTALQQMNRRVDSGVATAAVSTSWLREAGLLTS